MPTKKQLANLKRAVAAQVAEGFTEADEIVMGFVEDADEEEYGELDEEEVETLVDQSIRAHHRKQVRWKLPTDCDKLDAAFKALERKGVVARQHFTCCSNCGHHEIWDEIKEVRAKRKVVGYAFYHMQDTQAAVDGGGIYVKFSAVEDDDVKKRVVGQKVVDSLTAAGLKPRWDGNPNCAIAVSLKWRKRRTDKPSKGKS
jgi:cytochrome c556